jgi:two-component system phosphate regulon response regulator OmpR
LRRLPLRCAAVASAGIEPVRRRCVAALYSERTPPKGGITMRTMGPAANLLVVDDDASVRNMLREYLAGHGYAVRVAGDGQTMRSELERELPDLVLLDVRLPGEDGLTLARFLREHYDLGIVMVTASGDTIDRVVGLEVGADDYIAKPFDPRELLARVKSVLRRMQARPVSTGTAGTTTVATRIAFGQCTFDPEARTLFDAAGSEVVLTAMEFDLLKVFADHPGKALSRDRLLTLTRNREWDPYDRSIDIRVARLRRKIGDRGDEPGVIRTVRGVGYMYVPVRV